MKFIEKIKLLIKNLSKNKGDLELEKLLMQYPMLITKAVDQLRLLLTHLDNYQVSNREIIELEHQGDEVKRAIHNLLNRVFILSWIDVEDAFKLSEELDHCLNTAKTLANYIDDFRPSSIPDSIQTQIQGLLNCIIEINTEFQPIIEHLRGFSSINSIQTVITKEEKAADTIYHQGLRNLWRARNEATSLKNQLKAELDYDCWLPIIQELERLTDEFHHVVAIIYSIITKH